MKGDLLSSVIMIIICTQRNMMCHSEVTKCCFY